MHSEALLFALGLSHVACGVGRMVEGSLPFPLQLSCVSLLKRNKTFILLLVGALVDVVMYRLHSRDTCLGSGDYSDLHKIPISCVLGLISVRAFLRNPLIVGDAGLEELAGYFHS